MTEPETDPLQEFINELKDALQKQDWERAGRAGSQLVCLFVTAKMEREDQKHNKVIAELAGIRDALELQAIMACRNTSGVPPVRALQLETKILNRRDPSLLNSDEHPASDPSIGEPVE